MKCQSLFSGQKITKIVSLSSVELAQRGNKGKKLILTNTVFSSEIREKFRK